MNDKTPIASEYPPTKIEKWAKLGQWHAAKVAEDALAMLYITLPDKESKEIDLMYGKVCRIVDRLTLEIK